jgi:endoglucanase
MKTTFKILTILLILLALNGLVAAQDDGLAPPEIPGVAVYIPFPVQIVVDGDLSDWTGIPVTTVDRGPMLSADPAENGSFDFAVAADGETFYIFMTMPDQNIITGQHGADAYWNEDSLEFYLNMSGDLGTRSYADGIYQIRLVPQDIGNEDAAGLLITGVNSDGATVNGFVFETDDGWGFEAAVPITDLITPEHGLEIGFQAQANGASTLNRDVKLIWSLADTNDNSWQYPSLFGSGLFFEVGRSDIPEPSEREGAIQQEEETTAVVNIETAINVNQTGYFPNGPKIAVFHHESQDPIAWQLLDSLGKVLAEGNSTVIGDDASSGDFVHQIEFSEVAESGFNYRLETGDLTSSPFDISNNIYGRLKEEALAYFYLNRSGIELLPEYAGDWARPAGHLTDDNVTCFDGEDTSGNSWPGCGYTLDVSGGWYDAGDYGKYVVNGGISLWTLLNQYERNPAAFGDGSLNIPESDNGVPDILDEARWEMEFMLGMQVPQGQEMAGMAHHKVHDLVWHPLPALPPTEQDNDSEHLIDGEGRYLYPPSTAATLNLAATAAQCARLWAEIEPEFADRCLAAAERAWQAASAFPATYAGPVPGNGGGDYPDENVSDEFYWAAAELFVTTGEDEYGEFVRQSPHFQEIPTSIGAMAWGDTAALGTISLALLPNSLSAEEIAGARAGIIAAADTFLAVIDREGYRMPISQFEWGSNSAVLNNMIIMGLAYEFSGDAKYLAGMTESMDYLMGKNPVNKSYISGYGQNPLQNPHHRFWANDPENGWPLLPPGVVAGGPNETADDPTAVDAGVLDHAPAKRYVDAVGSWSTNEITINWNAPLAWVSAFLDEHYNGVVPERPEALGSAQAESDAEAQPATGTDQEATDASGQPWLWALAVLIGLVLVGAVVFFAIRTRRK